MNTFLSMERSDRTPKTIGGHPIAVVAERTGLSRDVLRVWERRYGAVEPTRTSGGRRLYSAEHIARFRLLAAATRHGHNISMVARLPTDDLARLVAEDEAAKIVGAGVARDSHAEVIEAAVSLTRALDGSGLDGLLRGEIARHGLPQFLEDIVPRLMQRIGDEWHAEHISIAHEHLASAAILALVLNAMRAVPEAPGAPRLLVATPSGAHHAIGAALVAAAATLDGWTVLYLGVDVPTGDLTAAANAANVRAVALSVVYAEDPASAERQLRAVRASLAARIPLIVGGAATTSMPTLGAEPNLEVCGSIAEVRGILARVAGPAATALPVA